ncbi:MAG: hypothetical protein P8163_02205 [Candidatus Thiodiazotropha sp.]
MICKTRYYFYSRYKVHRSINTLLILLFLLAQTATLLHAEVHDFHDHEEYCDTFKSLEKYHYFIGVAAAPLCLIPQDRVDITFHLPKTSLLSSQFYEARASPVERSSIS